MQIGAENCQNGANCSWNSPIIGLKWCKLPPILERGQIDANSDGPIPALRRGPCAYNTFDLLVILTIDDDQYSNAHKVIFYLVQNARLVKVVSYN